MVLKIQSPYDKKPREVELVRKQIMENQVTYYGVRGDGVGYIYLKGFTDKSAQEVKNAFEDLKKNYHIKSLIWTCVTMAAVCWKALRRLLACSSRREKRWFRQKGRSASGTVPIVRRVNHSIR